MLIPAPDNKTYLPYQEQGIRYALERRGTLIADEMGLGKTVQAIGIINADRAAQRILIVTPASLRLNWWHELNRWQVNKDCLVSVVPYDQLKRVSIPELDLMIVDEAHYVKNAKAQRTIEVKRLAKCAKRVVLLTGTPMDKPIELWSLLQIVCPEVWDPAGRLIRRNKGTGKLEKKMVDAGEGTGFFRFGTRYCDGQKKVIGRGKEVWTFDGASNLEELGRKLRETCMVRRMKADVLTELPAKRRQILVFPSGVDEVATPDDVRRFLNYLAEDGSNYDQIVAKLRADKVAFAEFSKARHEQGLAKVPAVVEHVENALEQGGKIILFAHHIDVILALHDRLSRHAPVLITGDMADHDRQASAVRFQESESCRLIIGSIGAMGVGFTLTASSHVIFAEIDPVPGRMNQAEDRAHRIGQRDSVLVQHLVCNQSIDARMVQILVRKQEILNAALNERTYSNETCE